jgi:ATP adenylyltransferase
VVESLFAPWRFDYVTTVDQRNRDECIFCRARDSEDERATLTLLREQRCFALLNLYPYTSGHCMVAPNFHVSDMDVLDDATLTEMMVITRSLMGVLRKLYDPHGFNVGFNVREAAGAGIEEHLHLHIVPRWRGDTNIMGVVAKTRVIPEDLGQTFDKITAVLARGDTR